VESREDRVRDDAPASASTVYAGSTARKG
jgi:hypothetical protein